MSLKAVKDLHGFRLVSCSTGDMIDFAYLSKGLNAMARAHQMSSMAGHLGASLITGYFISEQRVDLDPAVSKGIKDDLDRVIRGESVFGNRMSKKSPISDPELFEPFAKEKPNESLIDDIAEGLSKSISHPRQSGHNIIFASIAIRALKGHPDFATPSVVDGIRKLMTLFNTTHAGSGYYGKAKGRMSGNKITIPDDDDTPNYMNLGDMAETVLEELIAQRRDVHKQGYGGLVHIINHAAAIVTLSQLGYKELVPKAIASHRKHLQLWRHLPNLVEELGPLKHSTFPPHDEGYWSDGTVPYDRALLTHRAKTMFGFDELALATEDKPLKKAAYEKLRLLM